MKERGSVKSGREAWKSEMQQIKIKIGMSFFDEITQHLMHG